MSKIVSRAVSLFLLMLVCCGGTASAQRVDKNVIYGMYSGLALLMDVHHPARPNGLSIILVPGSGWNAPLAWNVATPFSRSTTAPRRAFNSRPRSRTFSGRVRPLSQETLISPPSARGGGFP